MAANSGASRLGLMARRRILQQSRLPQSQSRLARPYLAPSRRHFSASPTRLEDGKDSKPVTTEAAAATTDSSIKSSSTPFAKPPSSWSAQSPDIERAEGPELLDYVAKEQGFDTFKQFSTHLSHQDRKALTEAENSIRRIDRDRGQVDKKAFWFDAEDPESFTEEHDEFDENDITEMAHAKLEEVKEMRHYQRLAVWELPLLSKLAKPFEPPSEKQVLRWRYTTYMGEDHPAEKKVVVQFAPDDLGLTTVQKDKLKKLAGPRYNPETEIIKMSCESYPHPAQNKRYLSTLVDDLIAAAKDPKDTFKDVPLDLRHHRTTPKPRFPKEWFMTAQRKKELEEGREKLQLEEMKAEENGQVLDGKKVIESYLFQKAEEEANKRKVEQLVPAGRSQRSSGSALAR